MKIDVTAEDISQGKKSSPCNCPVALALGRATERGVSVGSRGFCFFDEILDRDLPDEVVKFIFAYDRNKPVEPFSFEVSL